MVGGRKLEDRDRPDADGHVADGEGGGEEGQVFEAVDFGAAEHWQHHGQYKCKCPENSRSGESWCLVAQSLEAGGGYVFIEDEACDCRAYETN